MIPSIRSSTPERAGVEVHPTWRRCPPRTALAGAVEGRPSPVRRTRPARAEAIPKTSLVRARPASCVQVTGRLVGTRRTTSRSSPPPPRRPGRAPRRAGAGLRRPPRRGEPMLAGRWRHIPRQPRTAGGPTPVIIRVVHIAPWPDADLDDRPRPRRPIPHAFSRARRCRPPRHRRGQPGAPSAAPPSMRSLVTVRGVDDQQCRPRRPADLRAWAATSPLTPIAAATRSRPAAVHVRRVERRAQRRGTRDQAAQCAGAVPTTGAMRRWAASSRLERLPRIGRVAAAPSGPGDIHVVHLGEAVDLGAVGLGDHARRVSRRRRPLSASCGRAFGHQRKRLARRSDAGRGSTACRTPGAVA